MNARSSATPLIPESVACPVAHVVEHGGPVIQFLARFGSGAVREGDDETTRLQKQVLTVAVAVSVVLAFAGGALAWLTQHNAVAAMLLASHGVVLLVALTSFIVAQRGIRAFALTLVITTPLFIFSSAFALGGFVAAGASPLWVALTPLTAILFLGTRAFVITFAVFALGVIATIAYPAVVDLPAPDVRRLGPHLIFNVVGVASFMLFVVAYFVTQRERALKLVGDERARTERILLDVLPAEVADRLKQGDASIAHHEHVTVLFADLVGFTPLSAETGPERLVTLLSEVFHEFDVLVEKHGLEKIKTIGDCYMVASGVPTPRADHAAAMARFAVELREVLRARTFGGRQLRFRIGLHSGPVIAGVIGRKRFLYDLWGDTVNTASRMEQYGVPGEVQLSDATRELLGDGFVTEPRGEVQVKGKGSMRLFLLRGEATERRVTA